MSLVTSIISRKEEFNKVNGIYPQCVYLGQEEFTALMRYSHDNVGSIDTVCGLKLRITNNKRCLELSRHENERIKSND